MPDGMAIKGHIRKRLLRVPADRDNALRSEHVQEREQNIGKHLTLGASMAAIGQRVAGLERMQREDIPKGNRLVDLLQNPPDDGRRALGHGRAFRQ